VPGFIVVVAVSILFWLQEVNPIVSKMANNKISLAEVLEKVRFMG
jgi:hypothetical protein